MTNKKTKFIIGIVFLVALYPTSRWIWGEAAEAYFNHRCEKDAGEFVYRTVENVEGLFQMRPRDPRDYFTRLGKGDIPEDPYGHTNSEARRVEGLFLSSALYKVPRINNPYLFLETTRPPNAGELYDRRFPETKVIEDVVVTADKYWRYEHYGNLGNKGDYYFAKQIPELKSQYGFTWREVRNEWDKLFGVWGGELIVKELATNETLGIKRGYFYRGYFSRRLSICPTGKTNTATFDFISKVLKPIDDDLQGE